jgi:hypothetical protein
MGKAVNGVLTVIIRVISEVVAKGVDLQGELVIQPEVDFASAPAPRSVRKWNRISAPA